MITKIIEATQDAKGGIVNWGKFLVGLMDDEWSYQSVISPGPLMRQCGWSHDFIWVLDLQTGEGVFIHPGGSASADLNKHRIWVCPLFEPFLDWLYHQRLSDVFALDPPVVELPDVPLEMYGYRRRGPEVV